MKENNNKSDANQLNYIPQIPAEKIMNYCGAKVYDQAVELLNSDLLLCRFKDSKSLKAFFAGFLSKENYAVKIDFDFQNIIFSSCTCFDNKFGPCIHIGCVLLSWHYNPQGFTDLSQLSKRLDVITKEELLSLLCTVINHQPYIQDTDQEVTACG